MSDPSPSPDDREAPKHYGTSTTGGAGDKEAQETVVAAIASKDRLAATDREVHEAMAEAAIRVLSVRHPEITRLRAWLRLIEAEGGDGYEHAYYALHGYDAPKAEHIERVRKVPENLHPAEREAWEARRD